MVDARDQADERSTAAVADERFGLFMDLSPAICFLADADDRIVWLNRTFLSWLGRASADVIGKHPDEVHGPGAAAQFAPSTQRVLRTGRPLSMEQTVRLADGRAVHLVGHKFPVPQPDGSVLVGGTFVDVTARVAAERAWTEAEERFRTFMRLLPAMAYTKDSRLRYTWANPAFLRTVGRDLPEIIGHRAAELWPGGKGPEAEPGEESPGQEPGGKGPGQESGEESPEDEEALVLADGRPRSFRTRIALADGTLGHVFGYHFPLPGEGDDALGGVFVDLTGEMAVRDRMAEHETRLSALFERSPTAVAFIGLDGSFTEVNPAFAAILGMSPAGLQTLSLGAVTPAGRLDPHSPPLSEMRTGRRSRHRLDTRLIHPSDGAGTPVSLLLTLIRDGDGRPQEIIATVNPRPAPRPGDADRWTDDEITLLTLVAAGASDSRIARELSMGESTVRLRLGALKRRLDAENRAHLIARAYQAGVLRPGGPEG
ncbi:helix-turn-helix transcriptional regulator [Streptomyces jumonjinensis]|uniref:helix-turn-helix transcriptional regulator n=1 Tax=Streptomyces jumonjinensis TaxID=1945 RepID=UPI00378C20D9